MEFEFKSFPGRPHPKSLPDKGGTYFPFPHWGRGQGDGVIEGAIILYHAEIIYLKSILPFRFFQSKEK